MDFAKPTIRYDMLTCLNQDDDIAAIVTQIGPYPPPDKTDLTPYQALFKSVIGQQLHDRAASAILKRVQFLTNETYPDPANFLSLSHETLRQCGLSATKIRTLRGLADAALTGEIPSKSDAERLSDTFLIEKLAALYGIGRWTVEMFLIFSLRRPDVLPADDFGVRRGWQSAKRLSQSPKPRDLRTATNCFSPHRTALAWYLWKVADLEKRPQCK